MNSRHKPLSNANALQFVFAALRSIFVGALAALTLALPAQAATNTWNGSTGNWSTAGSWSTGSVPSAADDVVVNAGTVTLTTGALAASVSCSGGTIATNGFTLSVSGSTSVSCAAVLNGAGALSKSGAGTQTLTGANTYTGATTVTGGTLQIGSNSTTGSIDTTSGITLASGGTLSFRRSNAYANTKAISGAGNVQQIGGATTTLTGVTSHTGTTTVNAGTLAFGSPAAVNAYNSPTTVALGAKLLFNGIGGQGSAAGATISLANNATMEHASTTSAASWTVLTGAVTVAGSVAIRMNTTAAATGSGQGLYLDGGLKGTGAVITGNTYAGSGLNLRTTNNTFTGTMTITGAASTTAFSGGGIGVGGAGTSLQNVDFTLNGTMELLNAGIGWNNSQSPATSIGALNGTGVVVGNSSGAYATTLTMGVTNNPGTFSGVIADGVNNTLSITKAGSGTQTLTGTNTYLGATTITAGKLLVNGNQLSATGAVTVQTGATLGGSGTLGGVVTVNSGGILAPGNSPGTLTMSGLSLPSGSSLSMELGQAGTVAGTYNDLVQDNGALSLGGGTVNITQSAGGTFTAGTYRLINYTGTLTNSGGLVIGTVPAGFSASQLVIDTSTAGQVNLIVLSANATYWDVSPQNNGVVDGGAGTWIPAGGGSNSNWTDVNGTTNSQWLAGGTATFQGTPGGVTVTGAPDISGLTFNTGTIAATSYTLSGSTLNGTAAETVLNAAAGTENFVNVVLSGGAYAKTGTGNIHLHSTSSNTFTGVMDIRAGTLFVDQTTGLGAVGGAGTSVQSGASLNAGWGVNIAELITLNGGSIGCYSNFTTTGFSRAITLTAPSTISNLLAGACSLTTGATVSLGANALTLSVPSAGFGILTAQDVISGTGTLTKTGAGIASLAAANTYGGTTTVSGGTLQLGAATNALPATTAVTVAAGATLDVNGKTQSLVSLTSSGTGTLALGTGGSLTLTAAGANTIGAITGTGTITLNPGATLTLTAALSNTGVNIVLAGSTLNLGVFTHSMGTLSLTAASTLDFASAGTAQLTVATLSPAFALNVTNWTQGTDRFFATAVTGAPARNTINLSPLNRITLSGQTAQTTAWQSSNDEINALQAPTAAMVFSPTSVRIGANSTLSISLRNPNATALSSAAFSLAYPAGLNNASPAGGATTCTGGVVTAVNGGNSVALSGGTIPASSSCTVTVSVTSSTVAPYTNTLAAGALSSSAGSNAVGTLASLTVSGGAITGTVFLDDGAGGGTANDGIRNGSEGPQSGITMSLGNCSAATYSSTVTDSLGSYVLVVPIGTATNAALCVAQSNQSGRTSTGASIGSTVLPNGAATLVAGTSYTYTRAAAPDTIAFAFNGTGHSGVNFGDVGQSTFATGGTKSGQPGNTVSYAHTFTAQTGGSVSFGIASAVATPALAGWAQKIHADASCSGSLQPGAALLYPPAVATTVTAGQQVCVIVQEFIPANALNGYLDTVTVQADFTFAGANPALVASYTLTDVTKAGSGALDLKKEVRNVTAQIAQTAVFGVNNQAKTGETLEYRITYTNNGASPITNLAIGDTTPAYTSFMSAVEGTTPASLTACQKNTPANVLPVVAVACAAAQATGGTGTINFKYTGPLNPGATGSVLFQMRVN